MASSHLTQEEHLVLLGQIAEITAEDPDSEVSKQIHRAFAHAGYCPPVPKFLMCLEFMDGKITEARGWPSRGHIKLAIGAAYDPRVRSLSFTRIEDEAAGK